MTHCWSLVSVPPSVKGTDKLIITSVIYSINRYIIYMLQNMENVILVIPYLIVYTLIPHTLVPHTLIPHTLILHTLISFSILIPGSPIL